jgi:hypothetical protein
MTYPIDLPVGDQQEPEGFGTPEVWCDICGEALPYAGARCPLGCRRL